MNRGIKSGYAAVALVGVGLIAVSIVWPDPLEALRVHDTAFYLKQANFFEARGLTDRAIASYAKVLRERPFDAETYAKRGRLLIAADRMDAALHDLLMAARLSPSDRESDALAIGIGTDNSRTSAPLTEERQRKLEWALQEISVARSGAGESIYPALRIRILSSLQRDEEAADELIAASAATRATPDAAASARLLTVRMQKTADEKRKAGDLNGAIALYSKTIELSAPNTALHYLRGTALLQSGLRNAAAQDFDAGLKLDPNNATLKGLLAQANGVAVISEPDAKNPEQAAILQQSADEKRRSGDLRAAEDDYSRAIVASQPNTALYFLRGTNRLEMDDRPAAAADFEEGLKLDPNNATLKELLRQAQHVAKEAGFINRDEAVRLQRSGDERRAADDWPSAIESYSRAIDVSPPNTALYYLRGTARLHVGDRSGALADFDAGLKLEPNNATLKNLVERARNAPALTPAKPVNAEQAAQLQQSADEMRVAGDLNGAIEGYGKAIDVSAPNTALYYLRGTTRLMVGDLAGAEADFEEGLRLDPKNAALKSLVDQARATAALTQIQSPNSEQAKQFQGSADAKRAAGDLRGAVADYSKAIEVSPPNTALYYLRGSTKTQMDDHAGAITDFEAGLRLESNNPTLKSLLSLARKALAESNSPIANPEQAAQYQRTADSKREAGDLLGAVADYSKAIGISAPNTALFYLRGLARAQVGDHPGAIMDFEAGLTLEPNNPTLKILLAQSSKAVADGTAPVADPEQAARLQRAAEGKRQAGDFAAAIVDYTKAIAVSPPNTALFYLRGTARLETGDLPGATSDFRNGLRLDPTNVTLKGLLERALTRPNR